MMRRFKRAPRKGGFNKTREDLKRIVRPTAEHRTVVRYEGRRSSWLELFKSGPALFYSGSEITGRFHVDLPLDKAITFAEAIAENQGLALVVLKKGVGTK